MTDKNERAATKPPVAEHEQSEPANSGVVAKDQEQGAEGERAAGDEAPDALAAITAERDKLRDQLLRTAADFDNFRKRTKRDIDDARQRGKDDVVRELLPVFDNLERALQTADTASDMRSVLDGVRMVLKLFEDTGERMGLTRVPSVGERFDPAVHEAIQQQESADQPPGTILAEVVPGYRFGQRLVRPAMVVVARKPSEPKPAEATSQRPPKDGGGASEPGGDGAAPKDSKDSE